jgi:hypothetical protein
VGVVRLWYVVSENSGAGYNRYLWRDGTVHMFSHNPDGRTEMEQNPGLFETEAAATEAMQARMLR